MSEKTERWLTVYAPVALSLIAILASGGVAFGATQSTAESNKGNIEEISRDLAKLEDRIVARLDKQDERMDRVLALLLNGRPTTKPTINEPKDATSR